MLAGVSFALILLFAVNSLYVASSTLQTVYEMVLCILLGASTYLIWVRPKLILGAHEIEVVNPFRTEHIPYADVIDLETKWSLAIVHRGGKTRVWVAPTSGKRRWIAHTTFGWYSRGFHMSDPGFRGSESMSESTNSLSGQAAYLIRERIKRLH